MKICYVPRHFRSDTLEIIEAAHSILSELADAGFSVTLRTLYYQFVSRNLIANTESEYKRLGSIINDARLAGLIDWEHIMDRTRSVRSLSHWEDPQHIIRAVVPSFAVDTWVGQDFRVEVWIEKDALVGVVEHVCNDMDVPFFSCRGYVSQSEMWAAANRIESYMDGGQIPVVLHLGDHDPSGIDMTRDIRGRLELFLNESVEVRRIALNMDQIEEFSPPPNPAKVQDSRSSSYINQFGTSSWELDALHPSTLVSIVQEEIENLVDADLRDHVIHRQEHERELLNRLAAMWPQVTDFLKV